MLRRRLLAVATVLATGLAGLTGWAQPAEAATAGCQTAATAPTPGPGQAVFWIPVPAGTQFFLNTLVMNIGDPVNTSCINAFQNPLVVSVGPGAAVMVWGFDENTNAMDLYLPWGGLSVSQTTPINMTPEVGENWEGLAEGVSVLSAKDMLQTYGSCRSCDLTGETVKLPGYVEGPQGVLGGNVTQAKLGGATLTGNGTRYNFAGADLTGATVSATLVGSTLTSAIVDHTVFAGSSLQSATMNNLVYVRPPDLSHATIGGDGDSFDPCTNLGGNNLLAVPFAGLTWDNSACTGPVFRGSTVPFGMLGPIFVAGQAKAADVTGARIIVTPADRSTFAGANLQGANLANLSFVGPPLDLTGTHLDNATLTNTQLPLAQLAGATLTNVNASGLNLNGANLGPSATSTTAANLSGANTNLDSADFVAATVSGVKFVGATITNADFTRALGDNVDFTGVSAHLATFAGAHLYGNGGAFDSATDLTGADFTGAILASAVTETGGFSLTGAPLTGAKFDKAICVACDFTGAQLNDATFQGAYLPGLQLFNTTLTGAHFDGAWLYCGSPQETQCTNPQTAATSWPLVLGTGESYGPVPYTTTTVTAATLAGVASCPGGGSGANGCTNQMLPGGTSPGGPIPAACSASAHGSCPSATVTWYATTQPATSPLSLAAAAPLTWNTGLEPTGYYTGYDDHAVRLVSEGDASVFAGTPRAACAQPQLPCGDGGPATSARLGTPSGIAVGLDGSVYLADSALRRVRVVSPSGIITTVAGSGAACGAASCGDGGGAVTAALTAANGVAVDPYGSLYIADGAAGLRRVSPSGILSTVAPGSATGTLISVAIGLDGTVFAATRNPDGIIGINPATGAVSSLIGTGTSGYNGNLGQFGPQAGTATQVNQPTGLSVTLDNFLAFADTGNNLIRRYNIGTGNMAENLAGVVSASGVPQAGTTPDGQPGNATLLRNPLAVAATATADYIITDSGNSLVRQVGPYLNGDGSVGLPPTVQQTIDCRAGKTWTCRVLPAPDGSPRSSVTSAATLSRNGVEYARGPELRGPGGGNRFLVTVQRPLVAGSYTLTLKVGKNSREVAMTLTIG